MPRKGPAPRRELMPDPVHRSVLVTQVVNKILQRGKRSVAIDFATEEGAALVRRMAADADVIVENFKVGGLKKFGLDADSLRVANPRLIYASITGFGQDGPYAQRAGYDYIIQGMGGLMSLTGVPDGEPGGGPMKVTPSFDPLVSIKTTGMPFALAASTTGASALGSVGARAMPSTPWANRRRISSG